MDMYIAEKPSLAQVVAKGLGGGNKSDGFFQGSGWRVYWCYGHLLSACEPNDYSAQWDWKGFDVSALPMVPAEWRVKPSSQDYAKKQFNKIKAGLKEASRVINAGDPDREGQLIVDELLDYFSWGGKVDRLWLTDLTDKTVSKALGNMKPNSDYRGYKSAAIARQRADWLIGMNLTRAYSLGIQSAGGSGVYSIGRVQTPTLGLIVERDANVENFVSKPFYEIYADFIHRAGVYRGKLVVDDANLDADGYLTDMERVNAMMSECLNQSGAVSAVDVKNKNTNPPLCYSLSSLQADASKKLGFGVKKTLDLAQALYEKHKATTYPRTDTEYLAENQLVEAAGVLSVLGGISQLKGFIEGADQSIRSKVWNDSKTTAHTGIIPTDVVSSGAVASMSDDEKALFILICKRYIAQFYGVNVVEVTTVKTNLVSLSHSFVSKGSKEISIGWKKLYLAKQDQDNDDAPIKPMLAGISRGDDVKVKDVIRENKKTTPPKHFDEGSLVTALANISKYYDDPEIKKILKDAKGIGTEATRADIIVNLGKRGYVKTVKKKIISTEKGRFIISQLKGNIKSAVMTAAWENKLTEMIDSPDSLDGFIAAQTSFLNFEISKVGDIDVSSIPHDDSKRPSITDYECPKCDDGKLVRIPFKKAFFYGCSNSSKAKGGICDGVFTEYKGEPFLEQVACLDCGNSLELRKGKNGHYFLCNKKFDGCGVFFDFSNGKAAARKERQVESTKYECPKCSSSLEKVTVKKTFFPCSNSSCDFTAFRSKKDKTALVYKDGAKFENIYESR